MSKLKAIDPVEAKPSKGKIIIYGKPGVGKTWASIDFPSVYYIDTEGGANISEYTKKLKDVGGAYFGPEQGSRDFKEVVEQIKALATEKHKYKTVVIDSLTKIFNIEIGREADRLGEKDAFGASKKPAIKLTRNLINWIDRIDMNVILICHEVPVWQNGEQVGTTFDAWPKLEYELNLCLNIQKKGQTRKAFVTKSRIKAFSDSESFEWSYDEFAKKYGKINLESDVYEIVLASQEQIAEFKELIALFKIEQDVIDKWLEKAKAQTFEEMDSQKMQACIDMLKNKIKK